MIFHLTACSPKPGGFGIQNCVQSETYTAGNSMLVLLEPFPPQTGGFNIQHPLVQ